MKYLECVTMINTLTSYAILVPPFSTGNCCLLVSPATALTETVEGVRRRVTWKFSVVYYPHVNFMPMLTYEIAFLTVLCCVYNNRDGQVSSTVLAYYDTRNLQRAIERKGIKSSHISIPHSESNEVMQNKRTAYILSRNRRAINGPPY